MNTHEQRKLSESLLQACKAAGIEEPKYIAQGASCAVYHCESKPNQVNGKITFVVKYDGGAITRIDHPPYADDWQESLMEWVEPQESLSEWKEGFAFTETEKQQIDALADEPLANVLARHPESNKWCITIETEHDKDGEPVAYFIRDHKGDIVQMIRPDHIADTSKMIDACDIACEKFMEEPYSDDYDEEVGDFRKIYRRAWSDALAWWDGSKQASGIESLVCADIAKRQQVGIAKYGVTVAENPLAHAEWLQHAYEECLDMAVYLKRAMTEKGEAK